MSKKILIVEDNELNMKLFHDLLDSQGYEVLQTREGLQALAIAREHRPDLILMDIQLPEISGLEVTKWLKDDEELNHIPVRSEEHTSELQSRENLVCRLLLEKKNTNYK